MSICYSAGVISFMRKVVILVEENQAEKGYMKMKKWKFAGLLVLAWFVGAVMMTAGQESSNPSADSSKTQMEKAEAEPQQMDTKQADVKKEAETPNTPKQNTVVTELSGNANKSSDTFKLSGGKVTLSYTFGGTGPLVGAIYILEEGTDLNTDGGIPEVIVSEPGSDTTIVRKAKGDYYLQVNSTTDFTVKIEEER